jgi:hypothetical protein
MNKPISKDTEPPNRRERRKQLQARQPVVVSEVIQKHSLTLPVKKVFTSLVFWLIFSITVGSFLFLAYPRVSVYPDKTLLNRDDPFQTPFVLKNHGFLPIHDIHHSLSLENIEVGQTLEHVYSGVNETQVPRLAPNRSSTISLKPFIDLLKQTIGISLPPKSVKSVDIYIDLSYRPYLIPYTFTDRIRFKADISSTGEYVWSEYRSQ